MKKLLSDTSYCFFLSISLNNNPVSITSIHSQKGMNSYSCTDGESKVSMAVVGHLYAREAKTFNVEESLKILIAEYVRNGISGVVNSIGGGIFGLFIIDEANSKVYVCTDFLAAMPVFYFQNNNEIRIGVNQFDIAGTDCGISEIACAEYLSYGYLPFHDSLFDGVLRLQPGQIFSITPENSYAISKTIPVFPQYAPVEERINSLDEAYSVLNSLFEKFFSRIGEEKISSGLSGGYDSRLIGAYCRKKNIRFVTFSNPDTKEAEIANQVAAVLDKSTEVFSIPADAPSKYSDDFFYGNSTLDSLESSHVFGNLDMLCNSNPDFIIDGHIGDVILGGGYYYKIDGSRESIIKILSGMDTYAAPLKPDSFYIEKMLEMYGRKINGVREQYKKPMEEYARMRLQQIVSAMRPYCHTDADMIELLTHRLRGALLIAAGPISFMRRVPTLCPFYDVDIFTACMNFSKSIRAGERLYNYLFKNRFTRLAGIPKENTGGTANQSVFGYRFTHLKSAVMRKIHKKIPIFKFLTSGAGGDLDSFIDKYMRNENNRRFFDSIRNKHDNDLSYDEIYSIIDRDCLTEDNTLKLRFFSLLYLCSSSNWH